MRAQLCAGMLAEWRHWWNTRSGMEKAAVVWMAFITVYCVTAMWLHGRAVRLGTPLPMQLSPQPKGAAAAAAAEGGMCVAKPASPARAVVPPVAPLRAQAKIALLVLFYGRKEYLKKTMEGLLRLVPADNFAIIMSQDGDEPGMAEFVQREYVEPGLAVHVRLKRTVRHKGQFASYKHIADHYRFALWQVFDVLKFDTAVILEDDMIVAPDFFDYFAAMAPLLHADETLLCVSAWNDNGMRGLVDPKDKREASELRRTSVFPGLGWMLTRSLWDQELRDKWPSGFWDDWLREPAQTRGRECIFPTVSRTHTIGERGASAGQFFSDYLERIELSKVAVNWEKVSLAGLKRDVYRAALHEQVNKAETVGRDQLDSEFESTKKDLRIFYHDADEYKAIADSLQLMNDLKAGLPRSSFEGIVRVLTPKRAALFIVPGSFVKNNTKA